MRRWKISRTICDYEHTLGYPYSHVTVVESLPFHHRDPFDRMLIAQAQVEDLTILTVDEIFSQYDIQTKW